MRTPTSIIGTITIATTAYFCAAVGFSQNRELAPCDQGCVEGTLTAMPDNLTQVVQTEGGCWGIDDSILGKKAHIDWVDMHMRYQIEPNGVHASKAYHAGVAKLFTLTNDGESDPMSVQYWVAPADHPRCVALGETRRKAAKKPNKKSDVSFDQIAKLLDKKPERNIENSENSNSENETLGLTQEEKSSLRNQVDACWTLSNEAARSENNIVRIRIRLKPDGSLQGPPLLLNKSSNPHFSSISRSAIRAVTDCQPYVMPVAKYEYWKSVVLRFDAQQCCESSKLKF